jgi:hypothetical protein
MAVLKTNKELLEKYQPIIEADNFAEIQGAEKQAHFARVLDNTLSEGFHTNGTTNLFEDSAVAANFSADLGSGSNVKGYDPVLISLLRRTMPNMIAYDVCGVQPMTGPTGLIFAMRSKFVDQTDLNNPILGAEAFYNEADSDFTGTGTHAGTTPAVLNQATPGTYTKGTGYSTLTGERLGTPAGNPFPKMGLSVEKITVTANTRKLAADYTHELAQDLRAIHGIDAETELVNMLQGEILAEQNREIIRSVYIIAKPGAQNTDLATLGTFDMQIDSNGRWAVERFKGLMFQIEREANQIAKETRRGKGNVIICSSDVASALQMAGVLDYTPALAGNNLQIDDTGNTFVGILNGKYKVFVDPYATTLTDGDNFFVVGYKGRDSRDAGLYFAPYTGLQSFKAQDPKSFQPSIGLMTRYGLVMNPFAKGLTAPDATGSLAANSNVYFRRVRVTNLTAAAAGVV